MKMKMKLVSLAVSAGLAMPGLASAVEVAGKALDIYGKAHVSLDAPSAKQDNGTGGYDNVNNVSMSSNSSRLGFMGELPVDSVTGFYKIEASITFDNGDGTSFSHRAAYAGIKDGFGSVLLGYRDTPLKDVRGMYDVFGDTVGDARDIFGTAQDYSATTLAGSGPYAKNYIDVRAKNAIMYTTPKMKGFEANFMYSTAWEANSTNQEGQDNNNNSLYSINVKYKLDKLALAAAYQSQNYVSSTTGDKTYEQTTSRVVGTYDFGAFRVGLMYENMDNNGDNSAVYAGQRRSAYGANFVFKAGANGAVKLEYNVADKSDIANANDGASETAIGYSYKLGKHSSTYVMYSTISNDNGNSGVNGAGYFIGNGHDQKYWSAPGQDVSSFSVGYIVSF